jgi:ParB-like chromosome segregation protein Spo0J
MKHGERDMLKDKTQALIDEIKDLPIEEKVEALNEIRKELHQVSPFKHHPTDLTVWIKAESVYANQYNPNAVAPPELALLAQSIREDGYTQSIVGWMKEDGVEVVDGFHRNKVGKEDPEVKNSVHGYLPIVNINQSQTGTGDRMASTIRHNRARGTHNIELMSTIVAELVEMGKGDRWICQHVGMSADELLRLKQITGVAALFQNRDFSDSWTAESGWNDEKEDYLDQAES